MKEIKTIEYFFGIPTSTFMIARQEGLPQEVSISFSSLNIANKKYLNSVLLFCQPLIKRGGGRYDY